MSILTMAWEQSKAFLEAARAAEDAYDASVWQPAFDREMASAKLPENNGRPAPSERTSEAVEDEMARLIEARCEAEKFVMATPSPSLRDVIWKIEYSRERWKEFEDWPAAWWANVLSDLRSFDASALAQSGDRA